MADGDRVQLVTDSNTFEGRQMPSRHGDIVVVKLDSGYNVGIAKDKIKEHKIIEKFKEAQSVKIEVSVRDDLPTISILHTGGTIASRVDYRTGGVVSSFTPEDLLQMFPEISEIANLNSCLLANMWSDDLRFANIVTLAKAVHEEIKKGVAGIIIGMGTDNLAVAAAGVAFMVQNSPIPILFVGSQRSSDRGSSDAGMNLISAANFIKQSDFCGVAICMHNSSEDKKCAILPATKTYKLHSSRRDAFRAVNAVPYALINYPEGEIEYVSDYAKRSGQKVEVKAAMEDKVGYLRSHVNMFKEEVLAFKGFKGLVIDGTGLGHIPGYSPNPECEPNKAVFDAVEDLVKSGTVVVMCTQTLYGRVKMNVYDRGRDLKRIGVVSGRDMLANTALVKLSWLLANYSSEEVRNTIGTNMVGEISERTLYEKHFST